MATNRLIAHILLQTPEGILVLKRSATKNGHPNGFPGFWDLPGGKVAAGELPQQAIQRECQEELHAVVVIERIVHETSAYDAATDTVITRLFYVGHLVHPFTAATLNREEHTAAAFITAENKLAANERFVPVLAAFFKTAQGQKLIAEK